MELSKKTHFPIYYFLQEYYETEKWRSRNKKPIHFLGITLKSKSTDK